MPLGGSNAVDIVAALRRAAPFLKGRVARAVRLRNVPNLTFALDSAFDSAERIAAVLHSEAVERDLQEKNDC
jgi:ribosome-binding factor A